MMDGAVLTSGGQGLPGFQIPSRAKQRKKTKEGNFLLNLAEKSKERETDREGEKEGDLARVGSSGQAISGARVARRDVLG